MKISLISFFAIPFVLLGCSNLEENKKAAPSITVVINSSEGKTVMSVDEESRNISRAIFTDSQTNAVTTKSYSYDSNNNLRSVSVTDTNEGIYTIEYGDVVDNSGRSVMEEQTDIPKKVQKISKSYADGSRSSLANKNPDTVEYYYDENGKLGGIFRIDDKNNVIYKEAAN